MGPPQIWEWKMARAELGSGKVTSWQVEVIGEEAPRQDTHVEQKAGPGDSAGHRLDWRIWNVFLNFSDSLRQRPLCIGFESPPKFWQRKPNYMLSVPGQKMY